MPGALFTFDAVTVLGDTPMVKAGRFDRRRPAGERVTILDAIDLAIPDDGVTVLAGASGAGKSTLLRLCNRLEVPSSGCIRYRGDDIAGLDPLAHRREVGMVFQRPTLFAGTVRDNLAVARPDAGDERYLAALDRADLPRAFLDRVGDELSGGEAQRACLARTLVTEPRVLLMDEVTSSLDPTSTAVLERLATQLAASGVPVLWVTHDLAQMRRIADHEVVLTHGRLATEQEKAAFLAGVSDDPAAADDAGASVEGDPS